MSQENLFISGTQSSPTVSSNFDEGVLRLEGDSYPENAHELFRHVFDWINLYLEEMPRPFTLELGLLYLNTSSIKALMDILDLLEESHRQGKAVKVQWYYDKKNERVAELAEEFREDCTFAFEIIGS